MGRGRPSLAIFAVTSLLAVAVGAVVCALAGVPAGVWGRNLAAWVAGGLAAAALGRWAGRRALVAVAVLALLGVAATLVGEGQQGVRRWLDLGPVSVNAAMLLGPALLVALAMLAPRAGWWWAAGLGALGVLVLQPDASQASALALAMGVAAYGGGRLGWAVAAAAAALAAVAWTRPDPLAPVAEVEGVIGLAWAQSPALAAVAVLSLAAFAATPWLVMRGSPAQTAGRALSVLFLAWSVAPALGAFPVPLVGMGVSPILGAWLGAGLLAAAARQTD